MRGNLLEIKERPSALELNRWFTRVQDKIWTELDNLIPEHEIWQVWRRHIYLEGKTPTSKMINDAWRYLDDWDYVDDRAKQLFVLSLCSPTKFSNIERYLHDDDAPRLLPSFVSELRYIRNRSACRLLQSLNDRSRKGCCGLLLEAFEVLGLPEGIGQNRFANYSVNHTPHEIYSLMCIVQEGAAQAFNGLLYKNEIQSARAIAMLPNSDDMWFGTKTDYREIFYYFLSNCEGSNLTDEDLLGLLALQFPIVFHGYAN